MNNEQNELWEYLLDTLTATEEDIQLVTSIIGNNLEALESILYVRTGYRSLEQIQEMED